MQTQKDEKLEVAAFCDNHALQEAWALLQDLEQKEKLLISARVI
jgi:hypothetical protein